MHAVVFRYTYPTRAHSSQLFRRRRRAHHHRHLNSDAAIPTMRREETLHSHGTVLVHDGRFIDTIRRCKRGKWNPMDRVLIALHWHPMIHDSWNWTKLLDYGHDKDEYNILTNCFQFWCSTDIHVTPWLSFRKYQWCTLRNQPLILEITLKLEPKGLDNFEPPHLSTDERKSDPYDIFTDQSCLLKAFTNESLHSMDFLGMLWSFELQPRVDTTTVNNEKNDQGAKLSRNWRARKNRPSLLP
jgi:hypothetical protein